MNQPDLSAMDHAANDDLILISSRGKCGTEVTDNRTRSPFGRKRPANPPLRIGANQAKADFFQFHGKSSWSFLLGQVGSFSRTSQR